MIELGSFLPDEKNIKEKYRIKWKKKIKRQKIDLYLKVCLINSRWNRSKAADLQNLLSKYNIPADNQKETFSTEGIVYSWNSEKSEKYKIKSRPSMDLYEDVIILKVTQDSEELGKILDLMNVVKEYLSAPYVLRKG